MSDDYSSEPYAIKRMATTSDITDLLLFLTSSQASYITGSEFLVGGGFLLGPAVEAARA